MVKPGRSKPMMLKRQKVLLGVLVEAQRAPTTTELMKWIFLMRQETSLRTDRSFYDFVPHKYGPFSFTVYRDLEELARFGYVEDGELSVQRHLVSQATAHFLSLAPKFRQAVKLVLEGCRGLTQGQLVAMIYERYPWFASRSVFKKDPPTTVDTKKAVYTAGYEGNSIDYFMQKLLRAGVKRIIDVRSNPVSRKYGFSKRTLSRVSGSLGLDYTHFPQLGIPASERRSLSAKEDYERLLDHYEQSILPAVEEPRKKVGQLLLQCHSVLVCFEADPRYCHRERLAEAISADVGMEVVHL